MQIFNRKRTLNCRGRLISLDSPVIMGILNVTEDSFFDGGKYASKEAAVDRGLEMLEAGATIIDLGGMSSRPGAAVGDPEIELDRILPVLEGLLEIRPDALFSIDTIHASVARAALDAGAAIINDISAGRWDGDMLKVAASSKAPIVLMHMQGMPQNMQAQPHYDDVALEVLDFLIERSQACREAGIADVIIDPGLGFGKTIAHNYALLSRLEVLDMLEVPVLIGASRKSMIYKLLNTTPQEAMNGTTALHMAALLKGVNILRVHDIKAAGECIAIFQALQASGETAPNER